MPNVERRFDIKNTTNRLFDVFSALLGIILTSPFLLIIALLIKNEDKGPVFYRKHEYRRPPTRSPVLD